MPLYEFECCGTFEARRPAGTAAADCPVCGAPARRRFTSPGLALLSPGMRRARDREERSAHAPEVVSRPAGRPLHLGHRH
jgi:putative FmdB family regulatory protein